jgi:hypothetical protein
MVADESLPATEAQWEAARSAHATAMGRSLLVEGALRAVFEALDRASIDALLVKGVAAAHLDHGDPSDRAFGDADLLVRPDQVDDAVKVIAGEAGLRRDLPPRVRRWDRRFAMDIRFIDFHDAELDLHRALVAGPFGRCIELSTLWAEPQDLVVGEMALRALGPAPRAMQGVYSLTVGEASPRLATVRDLALLLASGRADRNDLVGLATRWRAEGLLAEAILYLGDELGSSTVPAGLLHWAREFTPSAWHRKTRASYRPGSSGARGLPWRQRPAYLHAMAFPSRAYRRAKRRSATSAQPPASSPVTVQGDPGTGDPTDSAE